MSMEKLIAEAQARIMERNPHLGTEPPLCTCGQPRCAIQPIGPAFWTGRCIDCLRDRVTSLENP